MKRRTARDGFKVDADGRKYITLTPTWRGLLPALVEVATNGTTVEARKTACDELYRLADFADRHNAEKSHFEPDGKEATK